jgi:malic enzyme
MAVRLTVPVRDRDDLSLAYTPVVAKVCGAIADRPELVHDVWASRITEGMKLAAVVACELSADKVIPSPFDARVAPAVTAAAHADGVARR